MIDGHIVEINRNTYKYQIHFITPFSSVILIPKKITISSADIDLTGKRTSYFKSSRSVHNNIECMLLYSSKISVSCYQKEDSQKIGPYIKTVTKNWHVNKKMLPVASGVPFLYPFLALAPSQ